MATLGGPQAWRSRIPEATQTMLHRLGAQTTVAWQLPSPLALPESQNQGQVPRWLRPSQGFFPVAAAQGRELRTCR
ncbi:hypothetical protein AAY473_037026 [Plecturocebus cupreus]